MEIEYRILYASKSGSNDSSNLEDVEDAYAVQNLEIDRRRHGYVHGSLPISSQWHCCISDGISNGWHTKHWAELLVTSFLETQPVMRSDLSDLYLWIQTCTQRWQEEAVPQLRDLIADATDSQRWRFEEGLRRSFLDGDPKFRPTAATLLVLSLDVTNFTWESVGIGDSCLFHLRDYELQGIRPAYQITSCEFDNRPPGLIFTSPRRNRVEHKNFTDPDYCSRITPFVQGRFRAGDQFILATDAVAKWFLRQHERQATGLQGEGPFKSALKSLNQIDNEEAFRSWLGEMRNENQIERDDVTVIILTILDDDSLLVTTSGDEPQSPHFPHAVPLISYPRHISRGLRSATKRAQRLLSRSPLRQEDSGNELFRQLYPLLKPYLSEVVFLYVLYSLYKVDRIWRLAAIILGACSLLQFLIIYFILQGSG